MFIEIAAHLWAVDDSDRLPAEADLIVPVSHGATSYRVTNGAQVVSRETRKIANRYPNALVAFGVYTKSPDPQIEEMYKKSRFRWNFFAGCVESTIEECLEIKERLLKDLSSLFVPRNIILVTDQGHSRRARIIWQTFFPGSQIFVVSVPLIDTVDTESPMDAYHRPWKIFTLQAGPTPLYWWWALGGPEYLAGKKHFHQPVAKK